MRLGLLAFSSLLLAFNSLGLQLACFKSIIRGKTSKIYVKGLPFSKGGRGSVASALNPSYEINPSSWHRNSEPAKGNFRCSRSRRRMARIARVIIPGPPHHLTQRGNGRARTFFGDDDYAYYRDLLAASCRAAEVEIWAWCLMPNHVHLILAPSDADGLRRTLAPVHRRYAGVMRAAN
jgi:Transposase IS200 like